MKLTVLFSPLATYTVSFFRHLAEDHDWRLQLVYQPVFPDAPYRAFDLTFCEEIIEDNWEARRTLKTRVESFDPDCVLMSSWGHGHFMRLSRGLRRRGVYVVATMDNQWLGSARQWLGVLTSPVFLKPSIDTFLVAGDRQAQFAARLGYPSVMYGYYAADVEQFGGPRKGGHRFLFVGRLVEEKGLRTLIAAYRLYRTRVKEPWPLTIVGTGPLLGILDDCAGVEYRGFVQPDELPGIMREATALILPSTFEPWGVVIHEAAAAGLLILCTPNCGASTYFVRDGVNGFIVLPDPSALAAAMARVSSMQDARRAAMSLASQQLGALWSPPMLAAYFVDSVTARLEERSIVVSADRRLSGRK